MMLNNTHVTGVTDRCLIGRQSIGERRSLLLNWILQPDLMPLMMLAFAVVVLWRLVHQRHR